MRALLLIIAGLSFWGIGFSVLYGLHGLACVRGWSATTIGPLDLQRLVLAAAWIAASLGSLLWVRAVSRAPRDPDRPLLGWLARASALVGLASMLLTGLPIFTTRTCSSASPAMEPGRGSPVVENEV